nr:7482_t:CDS:10 [Entrophospora candida]
MSHTSDVTFLVWTFIWFLQHVWNIDRFKALKWRRIKKFELKSAITILLLLMLPLQAFYDISTSVIKYREGFFLNPLNGEIVSKPHTFWSEENKALMLPTDYILCASFSVQTCLLFLLQSFWNYLANNLAKTTFMGSFEFKSYIVYSIFSISIFPILQYVFRESDLLTEVVPQLTYSIFMILICILGIRSHWRFSKLLRVTKNSSTARTSIVSKLTYFRDMNRYLTLALFIGSISLATLSIDGLTSAKWLNSHKLSSDLLISSEEDCVKLKHSPSPWSSQQSRSANDVVNNSLDVISPPPITPPSPYRPYTANEPLTTFKSSPSASPTSPSSPLLPPPVAIPTTANTTQFNFYNSNSTTPMAPKKSPRRPSIKTKTNDNNYIAEINVKDDVLSKLITTATTKTLSSKPYQQSPLNPKRSDKPESLKTSLPPITIRARSGSSSNVIESNNVRKSAINRNRSNSTNTLNNSNSTLIGGGTSRISGSASSTKGNTSSRGGDGVKGINTFGRSRSSSNSSASSSGIPTSMTPTGRINQWSLKALVDEKTYNGVTK